MKASRTRRPLATVTVETAAVPAALSAVHDAMDRFWRAVTATVPQPPEQDWRLRFTTAVLEIAANIVQYAYPADAAGGTMRLQLRWYAGRAVALFADTGIACPVQPNGVRPADGTLPESEGGLGLQVALAALNRLEYRRVRGAANRWRLVKLLPALSETA